MRPWGADVASTGRSYRGKGFRYTDEELSKSQNCLERERAVLTGSEIPPSVESCSQGLLKSLPGCGPVSGHRLGWGWMARIRGG